MRTKKQPFKLLEEIYKAGLNELKSILEMKYSIFHEKAVEKFKRRKCGLIKYDEVVSSLITDILLNKAIW